MTSIPLASGDRERVLRRVRRRIVPFAFICYVFAYIDRVNIGFAANQLQQRLGLSATEYGLGAGLFFLGYCLFEIPSNLILERVGARRWIARIMIAWGLVTVGTSLVTGSASFMAARVLLGIAEAGFFPGFVLYLTYWIPAADRARTGALFMMAAPVAIVVAAPLSQALLQLDGRLGLQGWQWLFVVEGLPAVVLGFVALRVLTDRPQQASWLPADDRELLVAIMEEDRVYRDAAQVDLPAKAGSHASTPRVSNSVASTPRVSNSVASAFRRKNFPATGDASITRALTNARVWLLCAAFFMNSIVNYGIFLWLPKLLQDATGATGFTLSTITSIPFVAALAAMVIVGRHSDRTGERRLHVAGCAAFTAIGLLVAVVFHASAWIVVLGYTFSQMGLRALAGVFWAIPPQILRGSAAAAGIALINALGNLGGFVGPATIGWLYDLTGGYTGGLLALTLALVMEIALILAVKLPRVVSTAKT